MASLTRLVKKALTVRYKKAKKEGYWNDSHIDQGFVEKKEHAKLAVASKFAMVSIAKKVASSFHVKLLKLPKFIIDNQFKSTTSEYFKNCINGFI